MLTKTEDRASGARACAKKQFSTASPSSGAAIGRSKGDGKADDDLLVRLRSGNEEAFRDLYRQHQTSLVGVAMQFVRDRATAEEVVQDTWLAVVEGLAKFEGRSSLKNWIFAILVNKARSRGTRDARVVTVGSLDAADEPLVDPSRFDSFGNWADPSEFWDEIGPERIVSGRQMLSHVSEAIDKLPRAQRSVLILRDVEQMDPADICRILGVSRANQRVLLHRARAGVRQFIERLLVSDQANTMNVVRPSGALRPFVFTISPRVTPTIEIKELL